MKLKLLCAGGFACLLLAGTLSANPVSFVTQYYNFPLLGNAGGGGVQATLNGQSVETFCDDFFNNITAPPFTSGPDTYSANVTSLSSSDFSNTRFGDMNASTDWSQITTGNNSVDTFLNGNSGTTALARYAMVSYLVSQYDLTHQTTALTSNDELQTAIWTLMDPHGISLTNYFSSVGVSAPNPSSDLANAANWYQGIYTNTGALNTYLSAFEVVSPTDMTSPNTLGLRTGGFQEQIVELHTPIVTPEPRSMGLFLGLLAMGLVVMRRKSAARPSA